jgi:zinc protease
MRLIQAFAHLCLWAVFSAAAVPAEPAEPALKLAPITFTERTLPNGLQVIAARSSTSPTVAVQVWYHVGGRDDPAGRSGFAHLFEHLMFKGTRYLKNEQFDRLTEDVGGENNAFTSDDVTAYQSVVPSNHLEVLLWAEAERMAHLNVDEANFKSERAVVQEEFRQRVLASPYGRFYRAWGPSSYLVDPYKNGVIGSIADLDAATLADVVAFHRTYYRPDNATLVVAGDFEPAQLQAWVDKYFGPVARPAAPVPRVTVQEPAWTQDRVVRLTGPKVPLPAVALAWLAPPVKHTDTGALRVAQALLSGGQSARLTQALVYRQQLAADAGFYADLRAGPGLLVAYATAAGGKTLPALKTALMAEVMRLAAQAPSAAELNKAKTGLLTEALTARQTPAGLAQALADAAVLEGGPAAANRNLDALAAVTAADVQRVIRTYLRTPRHVAIEYTQEGGAK